MTAVRDFERMFDGLPVEKMGISLNAHSTAPFILALFLAAMEKRGVAPGQISGSMTTDVLKDYVARGTWIYPPSHGIRMVGDILEYCSKEMPKFYPLVIRGPDIRDAGATPIQEVAFAFANAVTYLEYAQARGLDIDTIATRLSASSTTTVTSCRRRRRLVRLGVSGRDLCVTVSGRKRRPPGFCVSQRRWVELISRYMSRRPTSSGEPSVAWVRFSVVLKECCSPAMTRHSTFLPRTRPE